MATEYIKSWATSKKIAKQIKTEKGSTSGKKPPAAFGNDEKAFAAENENILPKIVPHKGKC